MNRGAPRFALRPSGPVDLGLGYIFLLSNSSLLPLLLLAAQPVDTAGNLTTLQAVQPRASPLAPASSRSYPPQQREDGHGSVCLLGRAAQGQERPLPVPCVRSSGLRRNQTKLTFRPSRSTEVGFGNSFASEAIPETLPIGQNSPQKSGSRSHHIRTKNDSRLTTTCSFCRQVRPLH